MLDAAHSPSRRSAVVAFFVLVAVILGTRLSSVKTEILNEDEALYAATAAGMATGVPIYHAGVESKPPGIFYLYEAGFAVVGRYDMPGLHALTIPWVFLAGIFVGLLAGELAGRRGWYVGSPAFLAAVLYYGYVVVQEPQVLATQCELLFTLPLSVAAWLVVRTRARPLALVAAGFLVGLGTFVKPTAVSLLLATGAWLVVIRPLRRADSLLGGIGRGVALVAGFGLVWLGAWAWFSHLGVWDDLVYWAFRWTLGKYIPTGAGEIPWFRHALEALLPWFALTIALWGLAARGLFRGLRDDRVLLVGLWALAALAMTGLGGRFYDHYFPATIPPLAALAACGWQGLARPFWRRLAATLAVIPIAACSLAGWYFPTVMGWMNDGRQAYLGTAAYVREHTRPDEKVFVWGYFPLIYVAADRLPASRFVGCHYLTGYAAIGLGRTLPVEVEDALGVPGGWETLLAELEANQPALFVDTAPADLHHWNRYPLTRYPALDAYVTAHYAREAEVEGSVIYRRRPSS
jgi:hypothetical protein